MLSMDKVTLSASPKGNGYQATIRFGDAVGMSSAETYPTVGEAIGAAAIKLLDMPERLDQMTEADPLDH